MDLGPTRHGRHRSGARPHGRRLYSSHIPPIVAKRYRVGKILGRGSFGCIHSVSDMETGEVYAVKFEHIKARFPQLLYERRTYDEFFTTAQKKHARAIALSRGSTPSSSPAGSASSFPLPRLARQRMRGSSTTLSSFSRSHNSTQLFPPKYDPFDADGCLIGIPQIIFYGIEKNYNCLVMEKLGPSLEDLFAFCGRRFSLKTTLMIADQMLSRMEFCHRARFLHRDIKPENWVMGLGKHGNTVYLLDFGLAKRYVNEKTRRHIRRRRNKNMTGTARYTSINSHLGIEQSRRDDLESIGYVLVYFAQGGLPWQGMQGETKQDKYDKISQRKMSVTPESLCRGLPNEFVSYFRYVRGLQFEECPHYGHLRALFRDCFVRLGHKYDFMYDWCLLYKPIFTFDDVSRYANEVPFPEDGDNSSRRSWNEESV